jgi:hypothetical protein
MFGVTPKVKNPLGAFFLKSLKIIKMKRKNANQQLIFYLGAPLQASVFISRHKGLLHHCNSAAASYLFQVSFLLGIGTKFTLSCNLNLGIGNYIYTYLYVI